MALSPWDEVLKNANECIGLGWTCYQQFNCADCGAKQTMPDKNVFHRRGKCEECGGVTDIAKDGMNFMATTGF